MHTDPTGTCSSQSGCGTSAPINPFPRSCRVPREGSPKQGAQRIWCPPRVWSQIRDGLAAENQSPLLCCLCPSAVFPQRHFPAFWGHFSVLGTQAETRTGQSKVRHTFPGGEEKEHKLLGIKYFFSSQPTASPAQSSWAPAGSQGSPFVLQLSFNGYLGIFSTKAAPSSPGAQC